MTTRLRAVWIRWRALVLFVALLAGSLLVSRPSTGAGWTVYGAAAFLLLGLKGLAASAGSDPTLDQVSDTARARWLLERSTMAIVPVFNEDPEMLTSCLASILAQPETVGVIVVDDASTDLDCRARVDQLAVWWPNGRVVVVRFPENRGKRAALQAGLRAGVREWPGVNLVATVDSDTVLDGRAFDEAALRLYADGQTAAVTAAVRALNWRTNVITRLQDLRYSSAFLWERAAYSRAGAVLCVCGSCTVWRRDLFEELVEVLASQEFLGQPCTYGDDRHLTNLALQRRWKVRLGERVRAETLVPVTVGHWARQQARWSRSFVRETAWAVRHLPPGWARWFTIVELVSWLAFTAAIVTGALLDPLEAGKWSAMTWLVWVAFMSFARSTKYFDTRADASRGERWAALALAPVYGILHLLLVVPLRLWALATLRRVSWGTRATVEVEAGPDVIEVRRGSGRR